MQIADLAMQHKTALAFGCMPAEPHCAVGRPIPEPPQIGF